MSSEKYVLPSSTEVRKRIEELPEEKVKLGSFDVPLDGTAAKYGFLYQYLIAGRVVEVFGKYAPQGRHFDRFKIDGEIATLFIVKTGKRKTKRGWLLRPENWI